MSWPTPHPGLVIHYSYLWAREAQAGREEGTKDRPCAVILAVRRGDEELVWVLPITHSAPTGPTDAIELPATVKAHLGLDQDRSWVVVTEANVFAWPGPDLRFLPGEGPESSVFGMLPPAFLRRVRDRFAANIEARRTSVTRRTE